MCLRNSRFSYGTKKCLMVKEFMSLWLFTSIYTYKCMCVYITLKLQNHSL